MATSLCFVWMDGRVATFYSCSHGDLNGRWSGHQLPLNFLFIALMFEWMVSVEDGHVPFLFWMEGWVDDILPLHVGFMFVCEWTGRWPLFTPLPCLLFISCLFEGLVIGHLLPFLRGMAARPPPLVFLWVFEWMLQWPPLAPSFSSMNELIAQMDRLSGHPPYILQLPSVRLFSL